MLAPDCPAWCDGSEHAPRLRQIEMFQHTLEVGRVPLERPRIGEVVAWVAQDGDAGAATRPPILRVLVDLCGESVEMDVAGPETLDEISDLFRAAADELRAVLGGQ